MDGEPQGPARKEAIIPYQLLVSPSSFIDASMSENNRYTTETWFAHRRQQDVSVSNHLPLCLYVSVSSLSVCVTKTECFMRSAENLLCITVIQRHRRELKWNHHVAWQHVVSGDFQRVCHVFVFELSLRPLTVFMKGEGKLCVKEEDVVTSHFWTSLFAPRATPFYRNSLACQQCKLLSVGPHALMWSTVQGRKNKKKSTNNKWREAGSRVFSEGVQRRHSCGCCCSGFKDSLSLVWLHWNSSP